MNLAKILSFLLELLAKFLNSLNKFSYSVSWIQLFTELNSVDNWIQFAELQQILLQGDCKWMDPPIQKGQITILLCTEIINFCTWLMGMKKLIFHFTNFFCWGHFLIHHFWKKWAKNDPSKKNFASKKSVLSYHSATKEFLKSMFYFQTFLSEICCSCVLPFLRQNVLSRASINSE